ncbi:hypothetical protein [Deinococcus sonorensis]|uniref:Single-stranded DNA-binding protein n=1 Tax=Deinococcus sonorensis TaxID=309891 RepID=A0ABV8YB36_9DEIO
MTQTLTPPATVHVLTTLRVWLHGALVATPTDQHGVLDFTVAGFEHRLGRASSAFYARCRARGEQRDQLLAAPPGAQLIIEGHLFSPRDQGSRARRMWTRVEHLIVAPVPPVLERDRQGGLLTPGGLNLVRIDAWLAAPPEVHRLPGQDRQVANLLLRTDDECALIEASAYGPLAPVFTTFHKGDRLQAMARQVRHNRPSAAGPTEYPGLELLGPEARTDRAAHP